MGILDKITFDKSISSDKKLAKTGKRVFNKLRRILSSERDHQNDLDNAIKNKDIQGIYKNMSGLVIEFKEEFDLLVEIRHIENVLNTRLTESEKNLESAIVDLESKGLKSDNLKKLLSQVKSEEGRMVTEKRTERKHEKYQMRDAA